jgi:hypothetical protein
VRAQTVRVQTVRAQTVRVQTVRAQTVRVQTVRAQTVRVQTVRVQTLSAQAQPGTSPWSPRSARVTQRSTVKRCYCLQYCWRGYWSRQQRLRLRRHSKE